MSTTSSAPACCSPSPPGAITTPGSRSARSSSSTCAHRPPSPSASASFVGDVSFAVADAGGGIHKYVGDEVIATWRLAPGANPPACVSAVFAALDRIAAQGPAYKREFGVVPDFRAALHCGPVAVGELGSLRQEIALIGDTMNTAARILEACRDTGNRVLASAALIARLAPLDPGVTLRRLGEFPVRGKEYRLELDALEACSSRRSVEDVPSPTGARR